MIQFDLQAYFSDGLVNNHQLDLQKFKEFMFNYTTTSKDFFAKDESIRKLKGLHWIIIETHLN